MLTDYAPTPWRLGGFYGATMDEIVAANGRTIAVVWTHGNDRKGNAPSSRHAATPNPDGMAVAKLMIAAPMLRSALLEIAALTTAEGTEAEDMVAQIQGIVQGIVRAALAPLA